MRIPIRHAFATGVLASAALTSFARAEDADRFRPYFKFHSGDIEPLWDVDDHWSFGLGANFNRYLGAELAFDYFSKDWGEPVPAAEVSIYNIVPELRVRYPLFKDRLVPYVVAGIGPSWLQAKDNKSWALDKKIEVEGYSYSVVAGAGLEYFIADNLTFGVEGKYMWVDPIEGRIDGQKQEVDLSSPMFTFGLRIYFDENTPRPLVSEEEHATSRFYFGVRLGADILTDDQWVPGVKWTPEQAAWGGIASQTGGLLLGADLGDNWGIELSGDHVNHVVEVEGLGPTTEYGQGWVLASLRLRYPTKRWTPYLLLGAGVCYTELKDQKIGSWHLEQSGGGFHPAIGVGGGFEYFIVRNFSIGSEVRWAYSWDHEYELEGHVPRSSGDLSYFAATIGFRVYLFDL